MKLTHKILDELPDELGMHKIMPPYVIPYKGNEDPTKFDKGGVSGVVIIAESHIGIHTFIDQEYAFVDIFSCKEFDINKAIDYLSKAYGATSHERILLTRGRDFPKNVQKSAQLLKAQRTVRTKRMEGQ